MKHWRQAFILSQKELVRAEAANCELRDKLAQMVFENTRLRRELAKHNGDHLDSILGDLVEDTFDAEDAEDNA